MRSDAVRCGQMRSDAVRCGQMHFARSRIHPISPRNIMLTIRYADVERGDSLYYNAIDLIPSILGATSVTAHHHNPRHELANDDMNQRRVSSVAERNIMLTIRCADVERGDSLYYNAIDSCRR